ncbi:hypothetical protein OSB04_020756 [Centaurea solstitialis]|uniref:Beta-carotene isomerase D27-like C-terminal domain-containing protein n=1 Tax=Centaurea solstitialis TaxID=347529 RepID=A0AA38TCH4_9ASTR|nr:hypothetical protein OSB04_020756 [Centaurea solstitialis]
METTMFSTPATIKIPSFVPPTACWPKRNRLVVVSVMTPSTSTNDLNTEATRSYNKVIVPIKTVYNDNWLERAAISYLSRAVQDAIGMTNKENGYESLVVAARTVFLSFDPIKQRQLVAKALQNAIPEPISFMANKKGDATFEILKGVFCSLHHYLLPWLVGPCQVTESEFEGRKERNVVHIKKCRFLESSNCAGMCTNLCKMPSQEFIKNSFGIPINMVPNFDDMSCDMIFGQDPPSLKDDPAFKQPCYKLLYYLKNIRT